MPGRSSRWRQRRGLLCRAAAPLCARAAARLARCERGAASRWRPSPAPCRRCGAEFEGCRFAPRCSQAMPQCADTRPALIDSRAQRQVRCLLYAPGRCGAGGRSRRPGAHRPARRGASADAASAAAPLLQVQHLSVAFPIRQRPAAARHRQLPGGARRELRGGARPHAGAGGRIGLRQDDHRQGHRATAARPGARSTARRCSRAATCSSCTATRCWPRGATSRSSSRTRSRR